MQKEKQSPLDALKSVLIHASEAVQDGDSEYALELIDSAALWIDIIERTHKNVQKKTDEQQ